MSCANVCAVIAGNLVYDCDNKSVGGVEQTVKLINLCDKNISDWTVTRNGVGECANTIAFTGEDPEDLNASTITAIPGKSLLTARFSLEQGDFQDMFVHEVDIFGQNLSEDVLCKINAFGNGAAVIAIVEDKSKGTDGEDAFKVYGFDSGLMIGDFSHDFNENNGSAIITLSSRDPNFEPYAPLILRMTDYEPTKAFFDSL